MARLGKAPFLLDNLRICRVFKKQKCDETIWKFEPICIL